MKGGIAAMLDAVSKIDFKKLKYGMKLYFTYNEEIEFKGINELVKNNEKFPQYMIFGEPTNNEYLTGSKGLLKYEINFKGKKAHSSNPEKGISSNMNAIKFVYELDEFYNNNIRTIEEPQFDIPYTTMNVGIIQGGSAVNSVSAHCKISIDFRIADKEHIGVLKNKVDDLSKKYNAEVRIIDLREPYIDNIEFIENAKTANFITEASAINGVKRIILGTGPVTAHEVDEHISVYSYDKLIKQYEELIYKICR